MRIIIICIYNLSESIARCAVVKSDLYDPDLPTADAVMGSLCCVSTRYIKSPSRELAALALRLAYTLSAPEYAGTPSMAGIAEHLQQQWRDEMAMYETDSSLEDAVQMMANLMPQHSTMQ
jgi:hypothetical protein